MASISLIEDIEKELRSIVMRTSLDELTGKADKKPDLLNTYKYHFTT
jgi:hypothetical protein